MTRDESSSTESSIGSDTSRRRFLALAGAAGITGLAGCGGGGGDGSGGDGSGGDGSGGDGSGGDGGGSDGGGSGDGGGDGGGSDGGGGGDGGGDGGDGSSTDGGASDLGTVKVGVLSPMTGAYNSLGPLQRSGVKLAVQQINDSDEYDLEVEPIYEDTGTEASQGTQSANKVTQQEDADFLFGAISSSVALSLNEFAKSKESIYFAGGAAVPITGKACNEWVFRVESNTAQAAEAMSAYTVNNLGSKVWFHIADYAYGNSVYSRTKKRMQAASDDFQEVGFTKSKLGSSNFGSFISQIANSEAESLLVGMIGGDLINFIVQAANKGLTDKVNLMASGMSFQTVRKAVGSNGLGTYGAVRYNAQLETGDNQQFVEAFKKANDRRPGNFARLGYDSIRAIAQGVQMAGSTDPADVRDTLSGGTITTVLGDVTLRACDHQAENPMWTCKLVESDRGFPAVELLEKVPGPETLPPCGDLGCNLG